MSVKHGQHILSWVWPVWLVLAVRNRCRFLRDQCCALHSLRSHKKLIRRTKKSYSSATSNLHPLSVSKSGDVVLLLKAGRNACFAILHCCRFDFAHLAASLLVGRGGLMFSRAVSCDTTPVFRASRKGEGWVNESCALAAQKRQK